MPVVANFCRKRRFEEEKMCCYCRCSSPLFQASPVYSTALLSAQKILWSWFGSDIRDALFTDTFSSSFNSSMQKTLEGYQKCIYGAVEANKPVHISRGSLFQENESLKGGFFHSGRGADRLEEFCVK